jgi:hypothetical protein
MIDFVDKNKTRDKNDDSRGCGYGRQCPQCIIRSSVNSAIDGRCDIRTKGKFTICLDGEAKELTLLISASHLPYGSESTAVVTIEDLSNLTAAGGAVDQNIGQKGHTKRC